MKKILIILNESRISQHVIQSAINIAKESRSILEAVFLNDISSLNFGYPFPNDLFLAGEKFSSKSRSEESMRLIQSDVQLFKDTCEEFKIEYKIEIDKTVSLTHLIDLSRFSDLIIADSGSDSDEYSLKDILLDAHCPVLLVSRNAEPIAKIFLAYDGSPSSMYAIKMFSYIFPELKNLPAHFFQIASENITEIPQLNEIKVWASKHFSNLNFKLIAGNARKELVEYIKQDSEKVIVVMGAYSGSSIARLFLKSMSESVINETNASVFITHE